jgi:hypothetical protein
MELSVVEEACLRGRGSRGRNVSGAAEEEGSCLVVGRRTV